MTLLTMARYEWFQEWEGTSLGKRGPDYLDLKNSMAQELLDWALTIFPQLRGKVVKSSEQQIHWLWGRTWGFSFSSGLFWIVMLIRNSLMDWVGLQKPTEPGLIKV